MIIIDHKQEMATYTGPCIVVGINTKSNVAIFVMEVQRIENHSRGSSEWKTNSPSAFGWVVYVFPPWSSVQLSNRIDRDLIINSEPNVLRIINIEERHVISILTQLPGFEWSF